MLFVVCGAFKVLSCCTVFSLLLPVLSFVKNFADPVTVHAHEYVYIYNNGKNRKLVERTLINKRTKIGTKIFKGNRVITF